MRSGHTSKKAGRVPIAFIRQAQPRLHQLGALLQTAVDRLGYKVPPTPSFTNDVYPILQRAIGYQWVTTKIGNHHAELSAVIPPPATADQRNFVFQALRDPAMVVSSEPTYSMLRAMRST